MCQISLDLSSTTEKFVCVVKTTLLALSQLLEVACMADVGKYAEELLSYMCSTIGPDPSNTVLCVQQVWALVVVSMFHSLCSFNAAETGIDPSSIVTTVSVTCSEPEQHLLEVEISNNLESS